MKKYKYSKKNARSIAVNNKTIPVEDGIVELTDLEFSIAKKAVGGFLTLVQGQEEPKDNKKKK